MAGTLTTTDPNPADTFTYTLVSGAGSENNADFVISGNQLVVDRQLAELATGATISVRIRSTDAAGGFFEKAFPLTVVNDSDGDGYNDRVEVDNQTNPNDIADYPPFVLPLRINEFLANNNTGLNDGNGNRVDWIEIFNPNPQSINLQGYRLTDSSLDPSKWVFPSIVLPPNGYLVVFASGNGVPDLAGNLHTNFSLSSAGEYLALIRPGGEIDDQFAPA